MIKSNVFGYGYNKKPRPGLFALPWMAHTQKSLGIEDYPSLTLFIKLIINDLQYKFIVFCSFCGCKGSEIKRRLYQIRKKRAHKLIPLNMQAVQVGMDNIKAEN